jgi:hypothetical protein
MVASALIALVLAAPAPASDFHPGVGYLVSQAAVAPEPARPRVATRRPTLAPAPARITAPSYGRPPSPFEMLQGSPGFQRAQLATAIAAQAGMILYGIATLMVERDAANAERQRLYGDIPDFDPYPR